MQSNEFTTMWNKVMSEAMEKLDKMSDEEIEQLMKGEDSGQAEGV